jgi:hypothetical protein
VPASFGCVLGIEAEVQEGIVVLACDKGNVAAAAAVAAARTAARDVLLAPKSQTAVAAVPGLYTDSYLIDEHTDKWTLANRWIRTAETKKAAVINRRLSPAVWKVKRTLELRPGY